MAIVWLGAASASGGGPSALAPGPWGGRGAALTVEAGGASARVELDCAHGQITGPLALDADGRFDRPGTLTFEGPGPARSERGPRPLPARYRGRLEGASLTLEIVREDGGASGPPLKLEHGRPARLRKCG